MCSNGAAVIVRARPAWPEIIISPEITMPAAWAGVRLNVLAAQGIHLVGQADDGTRRTCGTGGSRDATKDLAKSIFCVPSDCVTPPAVSNALYRFQCEGARCGHRRGPCPRPAGGRCRT